VQYPSVHDRKYHQINEKWGFTKYVFWRWWVTATGEWGRQFKCNSLGMKFDSNVITLFAQYYEWNDNNIPADQQS